MIHISKNEIEILKIIDQIKDTSSGASVVFTGQVRDHNSNGQKVYGIYYESYEEMVKEVLEKIEQEVLEKWNVSKFVAVLRTGYLDVGKLSVIVGVSSEHRKDAFEACRYGIDNIKTRCPIWKKEKTEDGDTWVEGVMIQE